MATVINLITFTGLGLAVSYICALYLDLGAKYILLGFITGSYTNTSVSFIVIQFIYDWKEIANKCQ